LEGEGNIRRDERRLGRAEGPHRAATKEGVLSAGAASMPSGLQTSLFLLHRAGAFKFLAGSNKLGSGLKMIPTTYPARPCPCIIYSTHSRLSANPSLQVLGYHDVAHRLLCLSLIWKLQTAQLLLSRGTFVALLVCYTCSPFFFMIIYILIYF
jgi:hypothetical protein